MPSSHDRSWHVHRAGAGFVMALRAAPHPYRAPGATPDGLRPSLTVIEGRRGRPDMVTLRATDLADLIDELTAAGQDMVAMASRLGMAASNGRLDLVPEIAHRLGRLGAQYRDCVKPEGVA